MSALLFAASLWHYVFGLLMFSSSLFLILLVLVQRGRGGGLTGALGGMGGQSAFGAKAGDTFTKVTIVTATIWILIAVASIKILGSTDNWGTSSGGPPAIGASDLGDEDDQTSDDAGTGGVEVTDDGEDATGSGTSDADEPSAPSSEPAPPADDSAGASEE
jgi:preprotein translocase subunit SecG